MEREGSMFVCLFVFDQDCLQRWISIHQIQLFCHLPFLTAHVGFCIKMGQPVLWSFILAFNTQWIFTVKWKKNPGHWNDKHPEFDFNYFADYRGLGGEANTKSGAIRSASQGWGLNGVFKRTRGLWWINQECHRSPLTVLLIFDNCVCVNQPHCRHMMTSSFTTK